MRLLVDTNIILEVFLDQDSAVEAQTLLSSEEHELYLSDFSLHSIGLILFQRGRAAAFKDFLTDMMDGGSLNLLSLPVSSLAALGETSARFKLDFDDAYQYALAEEHELAIVSFDADFDRTALGRKTPAQIAAPADAS